MHDNNFDFLRLLFSLFVIVSHSYDLSGSHEMDIIGVLTKGKTSFSAIALNGFFTISGFLVFQSLLRSRSLPDYFRKRILRIYPGLVVALLATVVISFFCSGMNFMKFFIDASPYRYFFLKLAMFAEVPGYINDAFVNNPFPREVNGSLWTIPYEFCFYIIMGALYFIRNNKPLILGVVATVLLGSVVILNGGGIIYPTYLRFYITYALGVLDYTFFFLFGIYFCMGILLSFLKKLIYEYALSIFIVSLSLLIILSQLHFFLYASYILFPLAIISFGTIDTKYIKNISKIAGDLSYGVYLYAFVIQQALMTYFSLNYWQLILFTIPIALICGSLSWNLVEKKFITNRRRAALLVQ